jgi:N,N'-diacetyllegionaminate synthase
MTTIIAEAGVNHNGSIDMAIELIDAAVSSGADAVKFQTFKPDLSISNNAPKCKYQADGIGQPESQLEMVRKLELQPWCFEKICDYCKDNGIEFLSTPFDSPSIKLLASLNISRWKIPSGEITNLPYLRQIGAQGQPVILSTGMANLGEIESALAVLEQAGTPRSQITVLHCTTEYPAPPEEVNLRAMQTIAQAFGVAVGYSDHTAGIAVPIAAVAMGATVIEKHLTLDRNLPGPDHKASLEPDDFAAMVRTIRTIEQALGDGIKRPTLSEQANLPVVRKSLVAARPIRACELFSEANLTAKRPGTGISPMQWDAWIGRPASRDFAADELIE